MKPRLGIICLICLACPLQADPQIDRVYQRFQNGDLVRAREEFRRLPQTAVRDGNRLFISALLETDGKRARDLLRAAVRSNLDGKYQQEAYFRMIQLAEALGDTAAVLASGAEFLDHWETSGYRDQLLATLAAHSPDDSDEQRRYLGLLIDEFPGSYFGQFARLTKAGTAFDRRHYKTATTLCRQITNAPDDDLTPASLILLSHIALLQGESERALLNYNILLERYRHAVGEEELLAALRQVSEAQSGEEATEYFEGVTYSVQVGVFGDKDNAKRMSGRIEGYGYKTRITKRTISGNTYHVVLAGRFSTLQEAQVARQKLESGENEVFKVVVNDEK